MNSSERLQIMSRMLVESAKLAKETILDTRPDESVAETSVAYFAGMVGAILEVAKRLNDATTRIARWHRSAKPQVDEDYEAFKADRN